MKRGLKAVGTISTCPLIGHSVTLFDPMKRGTESRKWYYNLFRKLKEST